MSGGVEVGVVTEATQVLEVLLEATKEENSEWKLCMLYVHGYLLFSLEPVMMKLLLPLYVSLLLEPTTLRMASKQCRQIHDHLLQHVTHIGPKHPEAFRSVMGTAPDLNQRLKSAIQAGQSSGPQVTAAVRRGAGQTQQAPSIKLKMDFSNFK